VANFKQPTPIDLLQTAILDAHRCGRKRTHVAARLERRLHGATSPEIGERAASVPPVVADGQRRSQKAAHRLGGKARFGKSGCHGASFPV
jgi:hypothetical protein